MATLKAGDVIVADFPGITGIKRRPAVVVSTAAYHTHRPDVILGAITTNLSAANTPLDYALQDWVTAGLHRASAVRAFLVTLPGVRGAGNHWAAIECRLGNGAGSFTTSYSNLNCSTTSLARNHPYAGLSRPRARPFADQS